MPHHRKEATEQMQVLVRELRDNAYTPRATLQDLVDWLTALWERIHRCAQAGADLSLPVDDVGLPAPSIGGYVLERVHPVLADADVAEWVALGLERQYPYWWDELSPSMTGAQMLQSLEAGCDPTPRQTHNNGLQRCLRRSRHLDSLQVWDRLWQHPQAQELAQATEESSGNTLWHLLTASDWNDATKYERTTLGHEWLRRLDATGLSVHATNEHGSTPLHVTGFIEELLARGASIDAPNKIGKRPLVYAACHGTPAALHTLLRAGASLEDPDEVGRTALWHTVVHGHWRRIERLLHAGANPHACDHQGESPATLMDKNRKLRSRWRQWKVQRIEQAIEEVLPASETPSVRPRPRM